MRFRGGWCGARGSSVLKVSEVEGSGVKRDEESRVGARATRGGPWRRRASSDRALKGSTPHAPNICQLVSPLFSSSAEQYTRVSLSLFLYACLFICMCVCMCIHMRGISVCVASTRGKRGGGEGGGEGRGEE